MTEVISRTIEKRTQQHHGKHILIKVPGLFQVPLAICLDDSTTFKENYMTIQ